MAVVQPVEVPLSDHMGISLITWAGLTTADTGGTLFIGDVAPGTQSLVIHVVGGGTAQIRGSNDGTNFVNLGAALAANSITALAPLPRYIDINPVATATITVVAVKRKHQ